MPEEYYILGISQEIHGNLALQWCVYGCFLAIWQMKAILFWKKMSSIDYLWFSYSMVPKGLGYFILKDKLCKFK